MNFAELITFSRAGNATVTDQDGLIKWGAHNLVADSDDLTALASSGFGTTTSEATELTGTNSRAINAGTASLTGVGEKQTCRVRYKRISGSTSRWIIFRGFGEGGDTSFPVWDADTGAVVRDGTGAWSNATSTANSDGTFTLRADVVPSQASALQVQSSDVADPSGSPSYAGDANTTYQFTELCQYRSDLGGMQNNWLTGDDYVATSGSAVYMPRVDYSTGSPLMLVEQASTNLVPDSVASVADWAAQNSTIEDRSDNFLGVFPGVTVIGDGNPFSRARESCGTITSGNTYHVTGWIAEGTGGEYRLTVRGGGFGAIVGGAFGSASALGTTFGSISNIVETEIEPGRWRVEFDFEAIQTSTANVAIETNSTVVGETVIAYGAMVTEGYGGTYIPTAGATATRAAETASIDVSDFAYDMNGGNTLYVEGVRYPGAEGEAGMLFELRGFVTGDLVLIQPFVTNAETQRFRIRTSAVDDYVVTDATYANGDTVKIAASYRSGEQRCYIGGTAQTDGTGTFAEGMETLYIGTSNGTVNWWNGGIANIQVIPRMQSDNQLEDLTS